MKEEINVYEMQKKYFKQAKFDFEQSFCSSTTVRTYPIRSLQVSCPFLRGTLGPLHPVCWLLRAALGCVTPSVLCVLSSEDCRLYF